MSLNRFGVRLASLGAVWQQGVIPQEQTTRWMGGYDMPAGFDVFSAIENSKCNRIHVIYVLINVTRFLTDLLTQRKIVRFW